MKRNLTIILAAVAALSLGWLSFHLFNAWRWKPRDYICALLAEDVTLRGQGTENELGTLKKGAVLYAPTWDDYAVSDPGDSQLFKVYVRLSPDVIKNLLLLPARQTNAPVPKTVCNVLEVVPRATSKLDAPPSP